MITVSVHGCDDSTIFDIEATESEYEFLKLVAQKCTETSSYRCMPIMEVAKKDC